MLDKEDITKLLHQWQNGDKDALDQLIPKLYDELHSIASNYLRKNGYKYSLQPTSLVNEAYLKIIQLEEVDWKGRAHFLAVASKLMRNILVDYVRAQIADKRGGPQPTLSLENIVNLAEKRDLDIIALDEALTNLAKIDAKQSSIIEMKFFGGLNGDEIGEVLGISPATVSREWHAARLWLIREMRSS